MDGEGQESARPTAVFDGRSWLSWAGHPCLLLVVGAGALLLGLLGAPLLPWPTAWRGAATPSVVVLLVIAAFVGTHVVSRWAAARTGRVELMGDRLLIVHDRRLLRVRLTEIDIFDDTSLDYVRVVVHRGSPQELQLSVPTPGGTDRAALISALAAAGVQRDDGQPWARRIRASTEPGVELLVVQHEPRLILAGTAAGAALVLAVLLVANQLQVLGGLATSTVMLPVLVTVVAVFVWGDTRTATVSFRADRILVNPYGTSRETAWSCVFTWGDVVGWRSTSPAYLRLVLRPGLVRDTHGEPSIPTPTPEDRAAVETLLATRGVPRLS